MRKSKNKYAAFCALILFFIALTCAVFCLSGGSYARAADNSDFGQYSFYYEKFNAVYDIKSNREIEICEELTVRYTGYDSTGFMRDIPVNGGELVKNVRVTEVKGGEETSVTYSVEDYQDDYGYKYMTADIGDYRKKTDVHTYRLYYTYCLTKAQEGADKLALNVIGPQDRRVESADITLKLPEGFTGGTYVVGKVNSSANGTALAPFDEDGRTTVSVKGISLKHNEGVTFDLTFAEGSLSVYFDFTPYWFLIAGAVLLIIIFAVKFLVFNKNTLTPVVNFEAPSKMNPLMMGKLIDGTVDSEDITSMIFYWADKGYLKIDLENPDDPLLIRVVQNLPAGTPAYEVTLFSEMFRGNDTVRPSMLKNRFYITIDRATSMVNAQVKGLYSKGSVMVSALFAIIGGLLCCAAPVLISITQISSTFFSFIPLFALLPLLFAYLMTQNFKVSILKANKVKTLICSAMIAGACLFAGITYYVTTPSFVIEPLPKILMIIMGCATVICSVFIICRTEEYTKTLNEIVGFRNFISLAEKDRLEKMLEDDPQFYYHILPYAQVLGVSDKWEEKFESITVEPPRWATSSALNNIITFHILNRAITNSMRSMASNMGSRPSSSGGSGRGGFGGGHVGGGHGGGGSRGR